MGLLISKRYTKSQRKMHLSKSEKKLILKFVKALGDESDPICEETAKRLEIQQRLTRFNYQIHKAKSELYALDDLWNELTRPQRMECRKDIVELQSDLLRVIQKFFTVDQFNRHIYT